MVSKRKPSSGLAGFLTKRAKDRTVQNLAVNQAVFVQGGPCDAIFFIETGKIKISVISAQGKEAIVAIMDDGDFIGESCLAGGTQRVSTATAMTDATIVRIPKSVVLDAIRNEPKFAERFMAHLLARNVRVEADLVDQLFNSSEKRLARTLLLLANYGQQEEPETIVTKISQETLADMIGTTRSRVSFFMNKFRKLGFISYNGDIRVHRSLLNAVLHEKPHTSGGVSPRAGRKGTARTRVAT